MTLPVEHLEDDAAVLEAALAHAGHLVPAQSPLDRFVHHNPLHAFEDKRFEDAAIEAASIYGTDPFWPEGRYRGLYAAGRIGDADIDWALSHEIEPGLVAGLLDRRELARTLMLRPIRSLTPTERDWALSETDALSAPLAHLDTETRARLLSHAGGDAGKALPLLWQACEDLRGELPAIEELEAPHLRLRSRLIAKGYEDPDALVHPLLIRWAGGFLDHGVAYWPMSDREQGFFRAFFLHLSQPVDLGRPWLHEVRRLAPKVLAEGWTARDTCTYVLHAMGHPSETWEQVVQETLLALPGWTGMFQRLNDRPDTAPVTMDLPTRLEDILAVRLALDLAAAGHLVPAGEGTLTDRLRAAPDLTPPSEPIDPAYHLFQLAQACGLDGFALRQHGAARIIALVEAAHAIDEVSRRKMWQMAYERHFVAEQLDAIGSHARRAAEAEVPEAKAQVAFCIDDREESIRRHLEEVAPWVETIGIAGNYGIAMYYRGHDHGRPVALGPAGFEPKHYVEEVVDEPRDRNRLQGLLHHHVDVGSSTLLRGVFVTLGGLLASVPMALRILAPDAYGRWVRPKPPARSHLNYETDDPTPNEDGLQVGYTLDEMVSITKGMLESMGLTKGLSPMVVCLGHGSSSINNPHEAAYNCGACGGGRGGPNARLFALWANDPRVRERLKDSANPIPEGTWFVGGYHNTATDEVSYYDVDRIPAELRPVFEETRAALRTSSERDALERARRFKDLPLDATVPEAVNHVWHRSEDLAQLRPEYNHNGNGLCLVGRRSWSRGLFLDQRAFLCSYDPDLDKDGSILAAWLAMAVPVGAGINLEYWFGAIDPQRYGSGTKAAHNITGLIGVMDGHQSDLRTGLYSQMVELHEPVRLLCVVEASTAQLLRIAENNPVVGRLVTNGWVHLASIDPDTSALYLFEDGRFVQWTPRGTLLPTVASSTAWFRGSRQYLPPATIEGRAK